MKCPVCARRLYVADTRPVEEMTRRHYRCRVCHAKCMTLESIVEIEQPSAVNDVLEWLQQGGSVALYTAQGEFDRVVELQAA